MINCSFQIMRCHKNLVTLPKKFTFQVTLPNLISVSRLCRKNDGENPPKNSSRLWLRTKLRPKIKLPPKFCLKSPQVLWTTRRNRPRDQGTFYTNLFFTCGTHVLWQRLCTCTLAQLVPCVLYFDQHLGVPYPKRWSKYAFYIFCIKSVKKNKGG